MTCLYCSYDMDRVEVDGIRWLVGRRFNVAKRQVENGG